MQAIVHYFKISGSNEWRPQNWILHSKSIQLLKAERDSPKDLQIHSLALQLWRLIQTILSSSDF